MPVEIVFFNVGQGDSTLLFFYREHEYPTGYAAVLIDCGSVAKSGQMLDRTQGPDTMVERVSGKLATYLGRLHRPNVLDYLVVSHPDEDHFNLLEKVLTDPTTGLLKYAVGTVLYGSDWRDYKERDRTFIKTLFERPAELADGANRVGNVFRPPPPTYPFSLLGSGVGDTKLYMLATEYFMFVEAAVAQDLAQKTIANLGSIVLMVDGAADADNKRQKVFLMADAVAETEQQLRGMAGLTGYTPNLRREKNTWLKMGHHGSATSTYADWIDFIRPDGLFVSSGTRRFRGTGIPPRTHLEVVDGFWRNESEQFTGHWSGDPGFSAVELARTFQLDWPPGLEQRLPETTSLDLYYSLVPRQHEYVVHAKVDSTQLVLASTA